MQAVAEVLAALAVLAAQVESDVFPSDNPMEMIRNQLRPTVMVELAAQVAQADPTWA